MIFWRVVENLCFLYDLKGGGGTRDWDISVTTIGPKIGCIGQS